MRLTVVTYHFGAAIHIGGSGETTARTFALPPEIADYISKQMSEFSTITLAIEKEPPRDDQ